MKKYDGREDIKFQATSVYKRKIAPKGFVYWVVSVKMGQMTYSRHILIDRRELPKEHEADAVEMYKKEFFEALNKQDSSKNCIKIPGHHIPTCRLREEKTQ